MLLQVDYVMQGSFCQAIAIRCSKKRRGALSHEGQRVTSNLRRPLTTGPSLADQAYGVVRDWITSGDLVPSDRITERGLAERLGVSPTPVREAISRLLHERLLVRVDGRNLQVTAPDLRRLREMSLIQVALRAVAAGLAAELATDEEIAEIARTHQASLDQENGVGDHPQAAGNPGEAFRHDFHQLIVRASHSPSLIDMIATAEAFGRPMRLRGQQADGAAEGIRQAVDEHEAIVDALQARDAQRAEALMRDHTKWVNDSYLGFAERQLALDVPGRAHLGPPGRRRAADESPPGSA